MTRKTCLNQSHVDILLKSVCSEYLRSKHNPLRYNKKNVIYPSIDNSFLDLCYCYNADTFFESFKKINGIEIECKDIKSLIEDIISNCMARGKMPRTRTSSSCYKIKQVPISPPQRSRRLRTRRQTNFTNNFVDTSGDDDSNHVKSMRELRSSTRISLRQLRVADNDTWESGRPKRTCIKQKRISADRQLVVDNKNYYRVEVIPNKLRSSVINRESVVSSIRKSKSSHSVSRDTTINKSTTVKFSPKIPRKLAILHNEAENFLFPSKDESRSEEDTDTDAKVSTGFKTKANNSALFSNTSFKNKNKNNNKHLLQEESSMDSTSTEASTNRRKRKRRLTQAEAFILDNQRYYKFETPGSRLRYQGSYFPHPVALKHNGDCIKSKHHNVPSENHNVTSKPTLDLNNIQFSFELIPKTEPWYNTFQRQDMGEESYQCYNYTNPGFYKPCLLPYEMGPLPPLDPAVCVHAYKDLKKQFMSDDATASTSGTCNTPNSFIISSSTGEETKSSEDSTLMPSTYTDSSYHKKRRKCGRKNFFLSTRNPRKSPRQHASTLAILSSLIHQRKRRETNKSRFSEPNTTQKQNLSTILESSVEQPEAEVNYDEIAKNIDNLLTDSWKEVDDLVVPADDGLNVHCKPDAVGALEEFLSSRSLQRNPSILHPKKNVQRITERKVTRKRKKNRTGWPNKNRRLVFRKDGSNSRDGIGGSEHDNSSVNADSEENEESGKEKNYNKCNKKNPSLSKLSCCLDNQLLQSDNRNSTNIDKINGDVQFNTKINGINDDYELNFRCSGTPKHKEQRSSSSDNCAEVVVASVGDKINCVNVDLDMWENAERMLVSKLCNEAINNDFQFQPVVRVQKLDNDILKYASKQIKNNPSTRKCRPRRILTSSKSQIVRHRRGGWY